MMFETNEEIAQSRIKLITHYMNNVVPYMTAWTIKDGETFIAYGSRNQPIFECYDFESHLVADLTKMMWLHDRFIEYKPEEPAG